MALFRECCPHRSSARRRRLTRDRTTIGPRSPTQPVRAIAVTAVCGAAVPVASASVRDPGAAGNAHDSEERGPLVGSSPTVQEIEEGLSTVQYCSSSNVPIGSAGSSSCQNAGSSSAPSLGSTAADGSPRIGRTSTERRSRSCASHQSASCSENSAIQPEVSGQTLKDQAEGGQAPTRPPCRSAAASRPWWRAARPPAARCRAAAPSMMPARPAAPRCPAAPRLSMAPLRR
jgi:hypothetical protein